MWSRDLDPGRSYPVSPWQGARSEGELSLHLNIIESISVDRKYDSRVEEWESHVEAWLLPARLSRRET